MNLPLSHLPWALVSLVPSLERLTRPLPSRVIGVMTVALHLLFVSRVHVIDRITSTASCRVRNDFTGLVPIFTAHGTVVHESDLDRICV